MHSKFRNFLVYVCRIFNFLTGGGFHRTFSARSYENASTGPFWAGTERMVNGLFNDPEHCRNQWLKEQERPYGKIKGEDVFWFFIWSFIGFWIVGFTWNMVAYVLS